MTIIDFIVPGEPQGKGRARIVKIGGYSRMATPAKTVAYEGLIALAAQQAGAKPLAGAVFLSITLVHGIPASWSKRKREQALERKLLPTCKPDVDNVLKAVGDGLNGVAWADDKQIAQVAVVRHYGEQPHLRVYAHELA